MDFDTIIVSDIHLGSPLSMAKELYQLLSTSTFHRLILLGDIFSDLNFNRLTKEHWLLIRLIRKLSNPKRGIEVIWVEGNHDAGIAQVMRHILGVKVFQHYQWEWGGRKCIALHGHQFDSVYSPGNPWFNGIVTELYLLLQKIRWIKRWLPQLLDRIHTQYQRLTTRVAFGAFQLAAQEGASFVFCGHTHSSCYKKQGEVEYWNVGCWVNGVATYVILYNDAKTIELKEMPSVRGNLK